MRTETSWIWLGHFTSAAPADFFTERDQREDDEPLSMFAQSQGEAWYDHDFIEVGRLEAPVPIATLVAQHSYQQHYLPALLDAAAAAGIESANVFVLASQDQFVAPTTSSGVGYTLRLMGRFTYPI